MKEYAITGTAPQTGGQLFDLEADPGETRNLALEHSAVVDHLQSMLDASLASGRSALAR